ncbi:MAG: hypothetical protein U0132_10125 [Gemmatimonadaceae bacterium]
MRTHAVPSMKTLLTRTAMVAGAVGSLTLPCVATGQAARALIRGVPFVGWHETALTTYDRKTEVNPSVVAAQRMLAGYWHADAKTPGALDAVWTGAAAAQQTAAGLTFDSLKAIIRLGMPVSVDMALTPLAHPLSPGATAKLAARKIVIPNASNVSGLLGAMVPVGDLAKWSALLDTDPLRDQRMMATRVVVGFDDTRKVVILHDPSFGPAWELAADAFDVMWRTAGARATFLNMPEAAALLATHAKDPAYRNRNADERAAERFATTYAAASVGQFDLAERTAREALKTIEASDGYRHVLNLELGLLLRAQNRMPEAIAAVEDALKWINDSPAGWQVLAQLYKRNGAGDARLAEYATKMASDLAKDPATVQRLAGLLPADLLLVPFLDIRGWCGN